MAMRGRHGWLRLWGEHPREKERTDERKGAQRREAGTSEMNVR